MQNNNEPFEKSRARVLIAEDNADLRLIFSYSLKRHYNIQTVANGRDVLPHIDSFNPDVLILDINMPGMSGLDVLTLLNENSEYQALRVIVTTGNSVAASHPLMRRADLVLIKPVETFELVTLVQRVLTN
jgi:CheY-like chemotaxis protein